MIVTQRNEALSLEIAFLFYQQGQILRGIRFAACGDDSGESFVVGLIRQSKKVSTRRSAMNVKGRILTLNVPNKNPVSVILPDAVSSRELKLLFHGREQYRHMEVSATVGWVKELMLVAH